MNYLETLSQAVNRLQEQGFNSEILLEEYNKLKGNEWTISEICRFEGMSSPADNSILYAIIKNDNSRKSLVIDSYGLNTNQDKDNFIKNLNPKA